MILMMILKNILRKSCTSYAKLIDNIIRVIKIKINKCTCENAFILTNILLSSQQNNIIIILIIKII